MSEVCKRCLINHHDACYLPDTENNTCCDNGITYTDYYTKDAVNEDTDSKSGRGQSREASLKDPQSTGRKRAAAAYPLDPNASCEWQGLLRAGGGPKPIVGCLVSEDRKQTHRHHGPDKNTLNNDSGNVHRICAFCHNRYHAATDPVYNPTGPWEPHDPFTKAEPEDQLMVSYEETVTERLKVMD